MPRKQRAKERKKQEKTHWSNIPINNDVKWTGKTDDEYDVELLKMRTSLDPSKEFKRDPLTLDKRFQVGKIIDSKLNFYSKSRRTRKEKKMSLIESILRDKKAQKWYTKKAEEAKKILAASDESRSSKKNTTMKKKFKDIYKSE